MRIEPVEIGQISEYLQQLGWDLHHDQVEPGRFGGIHHNIAIPTNKRVIVANYTRTIYVHGNFPSDKTTFLVPGRETTTRWCGQQLALDTIRVLPPGRGPCHTRPTDSQELGEQSDAYDDFVEPIKPIAIADTKAEGRVFSEEGRVWLLSLDLQWYPEPYSVFRDGPLCFEQETKTKGGMSGSPIVNDDGAAVGVVTVSTPRQPRLARDLPGWSLRIAGFRK
jgi:hypothetical protein